MVETIGARIFRLREQRGMSQSDLARRLHLSRASIQSWECGTNCPSTDNLISLAKIFHVSTDYLLQIDASKTVSLDNYSNDEQLIVFRLLQYFDGAATALSKDE